MMATYTKLVKPVLEPGRSLDGAVLCKLFKDKTIYLQPSSDLIDEEEMTNEVNYIN